MRIILGFLCSLFFVATASAQGPIAVWGEAFKDGSRAVMIYLKTADANTCFKDVKIITNFGEDTLLFFGCNPGNLENTFLVYPGESDDMTKLQIQSLIGKDSSGKTVDFVNLLKPQYSPEETATRIDISINSLAPTPK